MRRIVVIAGILVVAGCAPDGEEALALCREEAATVVEIADSDQARRKNGHIEHCMRAFGYTWNPAREACGSHEEFRAGAPLSDDPGRAAACFRFAWATPSRFTDYVSDWLE
jgi:hypothetical protein